MSKAVLLESRDTSTLGLNEGKLYLRGVRFDLGLTEWNGARQD
jgi:hypothetical protein